MVLCFKIENMHKHFLGFRFVHNYFEEYPEKKSEWDWDEKDPCSVTKQHIHCYNSDYYIEIVGKPSSIDRIYSKDIRYCSIFELELALMRTHSMIKEAKYKPVSDLIQKAKALREEINIRQIKVCSEF
jgi:hypothetical protein